MSKISLLPLLDAPTGDEVVVVVDGQVTKRAKLSGVVPVGVIDTNPLPACPEGIFATELDADGRIMRGVYASGGIFAPGSSEFLTSLKARIELADFPASPEGIFPFALDGNGQIVAGMRAGGNAFPSPAVPANAVIVYPSDSRLGISDYDLADRSSARLRFSRRITDSDSKQWCAPAARLGFETDATSIDLSFRFSGLQSQNYNTGLSAVILIDGVPADTFAAASYNSVETVTRTLLLGGGFRRVEVVWPYLATMDFTRLVVPAGAIVLPVRRDNLPLIVYQGDSLMQGFSIDQPTKITAYLLGELKNMRVCDMGFGNRKVVPADADALIGTGASTFVYKCGFNNFFYNDTSGLQAKYESHMAKARAAGPGVRLVYATPNYSPYAGAGGVLETVRQNMRDAFAAMLGSDPRAVLAEGPSFTGHSADRFAGDGIHLIALGATEEAAAIAALV